MQTGWLSDQNKWYLLNPDGAMCADTWVLVNGKWYYFNPVSDGKQGIMFADAWIDGWYVDKNGLWNGEQKKE